MCVNDTFYGPLCDQKCSFSCMNRTCNSLTGTCKRLCKQGYFRNKCDKKGSGNCHYLIIQ
jgi:hypothetical protein